MRSLSKFCGKPHIADEAHGFASVYFPSVRAHCLRNFIFNSADKLYLSLPPEVAVQVYGDFNQRQADFIPDLEGESSLLPVVGNNRISITHFYKSFNLGFESN